MKYIINYPKKLSKTSLEILSEGVGYRNDLCYGSGQSDFEKVMIYELLEMGNRDILNTFKLLYDPKINLRQKNSINIPKVIKFFSETIQSDKLFCKWFTTSEMVKMLYDGNVTQYQFNEDRTIMVASDLDTDGVLLVSDKEF